MEYFLVSCEFRGKRRDTVEVPVGVLPAVRDGIDVTRMTACVLAERLAAESFGGASGEWFAWKIVPDTE
jgi:hypothetical protein